MNRPVDPLCRWIRGEMRYETWAELAKVLERERDRKITLDWSERLKAWVEIKSRFAA